MIGERGVGGHDILLDTTLSKDRMAHGGFSDLHAASVDNEVGGETYAATLHNFIGPDSEHHVQHEKHTYTSTTSIV